MNVNFIFKHDVRTEGGKRFICVKVIVHQPAMPRTGLWGNTEVDVWVPFPKGARMDDLRKAALKKAQEHAREFAGENKFTFESGGEI